MPTKMFRKCCMCNISTHSTYWGKPSGMKANPQCPICDFSVGYLEKDQGETDKQIIVKIRRNRSAGRTSYYGINREKA